MNIASAWWITNLATMTKCELYVMGERSDPLAASAASQAGRSVLRGAIAQQSALQLLVLYGTAPNMLETINLVKNIYITVILLCKYVKIG